jgi:hypothetical protein
MSVPTNEELAQQGMAVFRSIVSRSRMNLCTKKIARDRFCPKPTVTERGLYCERHRQEADRDHQRLIEAGWERLDDD